MPFFPPRKKTWRERIYDEGHYGKTDCGYDPRPFCPRCGSDWPCPVAQREMAKDEQDRL